MDNTIANSSFCVECKYRELGYQTVYLKTKLLAPKLFACQFTDGDIYITEGLFWCFTVRFIYSYSLSH